MNDNFVYVMSDGDQYKIGVSNNPVQRALTIRTVSGNPISLLLSINCKDAYGCERYLHNKYKSFNTQGEWFCFTNTEFLRDVWEVCFNNIIDDNMFICVDSKLNQKDEYLNRIIDHNLAVSYSFVTELLEYKYSQTALPAMMLALGCNKVTRPQGMFYITPRGLEQMIHKKKYADIKEIANIVINK